MGIACQIGRFQRARRIKHDAIALTQRGIGLLALRRLAIEGFVNRLAKGLPQFLLLTPIHRHSMRLGLPALLQAAHRINTQFRRAAQGSGFLDHELACRQTVGLQRLQGRRSTVNGCFPQWLQLGKNLFTDMPTVTPAVTKLVQDAVEAFPVIVQRSSVGSSPGIEFFNQREALCPVLG